MNGYEVLSEKSKAVCTVYYDLYDKKKAGCGKCPVYEECHGKIMQRFNHSTLDGLNGWINALNQAAERVG